MGWSKHVWIDAELKSYNRPFLPACDYFGLITTVKMFIYVYILLRPFFIIIIDYNNALGRVNYSLDSDRTMLGTRSHRVSSKFVSNRSDLQLGFRFIRNDFIGYN